MKSKLLPKGTFLSDIKKVSEFKELESMLDGDYVISITKDEEPEIKRFNAYKVDWTSAKIGDSYFHPNIGSVLGCLTADGNNYSLEMAGMTGFAVLNTQDIKNEELYLTRKDTALSKILDEVNL